MKTFRKQFVALAAPSGGGKTTLCGKLLEKYSDLSLSISFTTRAPRGQEKDGVEYNFVSKQEFENLIRRRQLIEYAEVHGNYYGTSKEFLEKQSAAGKVVMLDIDVQGVDSLRAAFGPRCLSIFILPPDMGTLEKRLRQRSTEPEEKIRQRLENAVTEMARAKDFDYQVVNRDLDESFAELCGILEKEIGGDLA
jgi:guanylate kinase